MKTRNQFLELATLREYDLVVIGGGIVGAGIAQDAACRDLSVLIIDKDDFGSGTSSKTTKLIHGGLRYLEQGRIKLTLELLKERTLLEHLAPHLVHDFSFLLPLEKTRPFQSAKATLGLFLYDLLAGNQNKFKYLNQKEVRECAPALAHTQISAGLKFHDAITDDARLVLEVIKSACLNGAHAINYLEATSFGIENNVIRVINCHDRYTGYEITVHCKSCVNATGVWSDDVLQRLDKNWGRRVLPAKGIHITVPLSAFETNTALFLPTRDHRYVFVIPWQRALMIGTTDSPYSGSLDHPLPNADEMDYLLATVNHYSNKRKLNRSDIIAAWAGLRPLIELDTGSKIDSTRGSNQALANQTANKKISTSNISREHQIFDGPNGIIGVAGGKLTNYRLMATQVVDKVLSKFPSLIKSGRRTSRTDRLMLGGWLDKQDFLTATTDIAAQARRLFIEPATIEHLISTYGKEAQSILDIVEAEPHLNERICPDFPPIMAEIPHCVIAEMALSLEDVLARRIRLAMLHHSQCLESAPKVGRLMQELLLWDDVRLNAELDALQNFLNHPAPLPR